jgi:hypothetical protein
MMLNKVGLIQSTILVQNWLNALAKMLSITAAACLRSRAISVTEFSSKAVS